MAVRLKEIDALRGLAVFFMVFYHTLFDVNWIWSLDIDFLSAPIIWIARAGQFLFLGLVGVSVFLSSRGFLGQLRRGLWIFFWGMVISLVSWLLFPDFYVRFGVLHFIGVSAPLLVLFKARSWLALLLAPGVFWVGRLFSGMHVETSLGIPFGLLPASFSSFDYFPLFPWLAVPLVGLWVGSYVYAKREPTILAGLAGIPGLTWLGRHALAVYLLHLPVVYFSLWGLFYWTHS